MLSYTHNGREVVRQTVNTYSVHYNGLHYGDIVKTNDHIACKIRWTNNAELTEYKTREEAAMALVISRG